MTSWKLNIGKGRYRGVKENEKRQPLWTTIELARKVNTNPKRLSVLFSKHGCPDVLSSSVDGAKKYGLHDFMRWWKSLPLESRVYATNTDAVSASKLNRSHAKHQSTEAVLKTSACK